MSLAAVYMLDFIQIVQNVKKRLMDDVLRILRILHKRLHNVKHQPFVPRINLGKFIFILRRIDHCKINKHFLILFYKVLSSASSCASVVAQLVTKRAMMRSLSMRPNWT